MPSNERKALRHASTPGRVEMRNGSPVTPQMRTDEAVPPAHLFEVFGAGGIAREEPLKLPQRARKRQPRVLVDVHENQRGRIHTRSPFQAIASRASRRSPAGSGPTHRQILPLGGVCVNRTSMEISALEQAADSEI